MLKEIMIELMALAGLVWLQYLMTLKMVYIIARRRRPVTKLKSRTKPKPKRSPFHTEMAQAFNRKHARRPHPNLAIIFPSDSRLWVINGVGAVVPALLFGHFHGRGVVQFVMNHGDGYDWGIIALMNAAGILWFIVCVASNSIVSWLIVEEALSVADELERAGNSVTARQEYSLGELPALALWALKQERKELLAANNGREKGFFAAVALLEDAVDGTARLMSAEPTD